MLSSEEKHKLCTDEEFLKKLAKNSGFTDIKVVDITQNVSNVLPHLINLINKNQNTLLDLYPKMFLTMLCRCLSFQYNKMKESPFGYILVTAKNENDLLIILFIFS